MTSGSRYIFSFGLVAGIFWAAAPLWGQIPTESWPPKPPVIPDKVKATIDVQYGPYPENVLDIYELRDPGQRGTRPGAIVIHGGGWIGGSRAWVAEHVCMRFVEKGFVVANVEYRVAPAAAAPAAVVDVLRAAGWFIENARKYGVDPQRIVVTGDSAGGHLALMVGMTPSSAGFGTQARVRAVVNFFGITDVNDQLQGANLRSYTVKWVPEQPGRQELAGRVSPLTYVRKGLPPILTIHGTADPSVPYAQGERITEELNTAGSRAVLVTVSGGSHGFPKVQTDDIYAGYVWPFLSSIGVLKQRMAPVRSGFDSGGALSCSPSRACNFGVTSRK
jgi:acetyl esterase/lipase